TEKRATASRRFPKGAGSHSLPRFRSRCALQYTAFPSLRPAVSLPAARSHTPASTGGARKLPGGTLRRLRGQTGSRASLRYEFRLLHVLRRRLAVEDAVVQDDGLKFHRHLRNRLGVAQEQV